MMTTTPPPPTTPTGADRPRRTTRRSHGGPPLIAPAAAWAVLTVAAVPLYPGVRPGMAPDSVLAAVATSSTATASATLLVASALPLLVFAASLHQRFTALGVRVAGPTIGLVGGILAAVSVAVSGVVGWTAAAVAATGSGAGQVAVVHALGQFGFAAGGPLFAAGLGLAVAGAAVPTLILRAVPRWFAVVGLAIAGLGAVALLVLLVPVLGPVLPVVRFGGLLWIVAVSLILPRDRRLIGRVETGTAS